MKLIFAGTGAFGVPALRELVGRGMAPALVVSRPDRPSGRSRTPAPPPLAAAARESGLPLFQPERISRPESVERLRREAPDVLVVISYGQILKQDVLSIPRLGCVNVHGSLLPRHRGASPVQAAILAGDETTGVATMLMDEGLDSGPVLMERSTPVRPGETAGELHDRLADLGAALLVETLVDLGSGRARPRPQDSARATFCGLVRKEDGHIRWAESAISIERMIRAYQPWPLACCLLPGRNGPLRAALLKAEVVQGTVAPPGTVLTASGGELVAACGEGALAILALKAAGRRAMPVAEFLRGSPVPAGAVLGELP